MKAFILAAGYGKRLRPLTLKIPKPLVSVWGKPLISHIVENLINFGIKEFVVNLHHLGDRIERYLTLKYPNIVFHYSKEEKILDTGGGLKKASFYLNDSTFLMHNGDILSYFNFNDFFYYHRNFNNDITLAVMEREGSRKLCFDENMRLCGWVNEEKGIYSGRLSNIRYSFCGIHCIEPTIFKYMPENDVFGIFDFYISNLENLKIMGYVVKPRYWYDIGDIDKLRKVRSDFFKYF